MHQPHGEEFVIDTVSSQVLSDEIFFVELTQIINRVLLNCCLLSKVKNHLNICFFKVKDGDEEWEDELHARLSFAESDLRNYVGLLLGDKKEEDDELPF